MVWTREVDGRGLGGALFGYTLILGKSTNAASALAKSIQRLLVAGLRITGKQERPAKWFGEVRSTSVLRLLLPIDRSLFLRVCQIISWGQHIWNLV